MNYVGIFILLIFTALLIGLSIVGYKKGISKRSVSKYRTLWIVTFALSIFGTLKALAIIIIGLLFRGVVDGWFD